MKPITLVLLTILFFSCEKEPVTPPEPPVVVVGDLLESAVTTTGSDTYSYTYGYDGANKLNAVAFSSTKQGTSKTDNMSITRNAGGIIESFTYKSTAFPTGLDNILYKIGYDAALKQYTNNVGKYVVAGVTYTDSVTYTYATGNIVSVETFEKENAGAYKKLRKQDFTYDDKGNIATLKNYNYNSTTASYVAANQVVFEYDAKMNALKLGDEGHVLSLLELISANNQTKGTYTDLVNATNSYVVNAEYAYNTKNRPSTAKITYPPSTVTLNTVYKYK
jgi:hypothetical protein